MASVWKRLQRVNKRAAKFHYTASYHRIDLEATAKWKPHKLCIVWCRRSRRVVTEALDWEPSLKDPLKGSVIWPLPENHTVAVTLFKDSRTNELEDKDWTFVLEDVSSTGKRRRLASCAVNMRKHASLEPTQRTLALNLDPLTQKIVSASLQLTLHCVLLREGQATDEDMQSLASLFSVNNNSDIAPLDELDDDDFTTSDNSASLQQMLDLTQQMEQMTHSLTANDLAGTPLSIPSLNFDNSRTPTAPVTPATPIADIYDKEVTPKADNELRIIESSIKDVVTDVSFKNDMSLNDTMTNDTFKGVIFKTKHLSKHNLKPLELKTNLNSVNNDLNDNLSKVTDNKSVDSNVKLQTVNVHSTDKTPVQDLLDWCKEVTRDYRQCKVTNLTSSWRNGIAFCAIIHHFRPDLIDFSDLQPEDVEKNLRVAFEASAKLGISQVLTAADICHKPVPDRLAVMTHLFQLRAHFTGSELQVEQLGTEGLGGTYMVGRHETDGDIPAALFASEIVAARQRHRPRHKLANSASLSSQESTDSQKSQERSPTPESQKTDSPNSLKDVRGIFIQQSKTILNKMLSPNKDKTTNNINNEIKQVKPIKLMTRKQLVDPFGSDEEEEDGVNSLSGGKKDETQAVASNKSPSPENLPKPTPHVLSRHDELKEKARQLLEAAKKEAREKTSQKRQKSQENDVIEPVNGMKNGDLSPKKLTEEERQTQLRERARRLIAEARAGVVSPASPNSPSRLQRLPALEIISRQSMMDEIAAAGGVEKLDAILRQSTENHPLALDTEEIRSPTMENNEFMEPDSTTDDQDIYDDQDICTEGGTYIQSELEALEREQQAVDEKAAVLEKQLRRVMDSAQDLPEENRLMAQWFNLVNKKNALLRRQMQLNILEQEEDLTRRCELLAHELRLSLGVEEWRKTPGQKHRERLLLTELLAAVNQRDRLVHEMDEQEKAIADDDEIQRNLSQVEMQRKNNCILQ